MSRRALIRDTLNAGLMKPRRGLTQVAGKKKTGGGQGNLSRILHLNFMTTISGIVSRRIGGPQVPAPLEV